MESLLFPLEKSEDIILYEFFVEYLEKKKADFISNNNYSKNLSKEYASSYKTFTRKDILFMVFI